MAPGFLLVEGKTHSSNVPPCLLALTGKRPQGLKSLFATFLRKDLP